MRDAALFVMPSRHEGFGNVLVEALACQCQIVATDCPHGPREILEDGRLGELVAVGDVDALAHAIERAMSAQRYVSTELLLERARDFSVSNSGKSWELLLRRLAAE
jgi:glycosyltransferase involved in cell wall biosynthesis